MPDNAYWKRRMEALEDRCNKEAREYTANIEKQFRIAQKNIEDKITYWYSRLADNNELTMQGAKGLLRSDELEEFHWSVEEYVKKGEISDYSAKWKKQLENASAKVHISRLEAMKLQMQQECEVLYGNMADGLDDMLRKMYTENYYQTAYELMKGIGIGWAFNRLDDKRIEKAINTCWTNDGKTFSDRVWTNKQRLVNELNTVLTQNIIRGESPQKAISQLSKRLGVSRSNAGRLIMTESAFIHSQSQKECFQRLDVERCKFVATLDSRTSEVCQAMDGTVIDMTDYKIGLNMPPLHCSCRSCVVPYYDDNDGMRAARGEDGKVYYVPSNMTYKEWKKSFVDNDKPESNLEIPQIIDEKIRKANNNFSQILLNNESSPYNDKMLLYNGATEYKKNENAGVPFAYNQVEDVIEYNPFAPNYELYDMNFVQAHELSHRIDMLEIHSWENPKFVEAVEICRNKVYDNSNKIAKWFSEGGKYESDMALSDIISALTEGTFNDRLCFGHGADYWLDNKSNTYLEIFANISSIDVLNYDSKKEFNGILKELYEAYKEMT